MEEFVGELWHKLVTRMSSHRHPEAAVYLKDISRSAAIFFRALGGQAGLAVSAVQATQHHGRRNWQQRLSGTGTRVALAWQDAETVRLPECIDVFAEPQLNRDLYFWLMALLAHERDAALPWLLRNQQATLEALHRWPGLHTYYQRLVTATIALRPALSQLPADEAAQERAIQQALRQPGSVTTLPEAKKPTSPVWMWLHPTPGAASASGAPADHPTPNPDASSPTQASKDQKKRAAERKETSDGKDGFLMMFRAESLLSWAEYVHVNRPQDDEDDADRAQQAAEDMDIMTVTRAAETTATKLRFDLDLPASTEDDLQVGHGIALPEWNYRKQVMQPAYCHLQEFVTAGAAHQPLPAPLIKAARRIKSQFQTLTPNRIWLKGMPDGAEIDVDAWVRHAADLQSGNHADAKGLYRAQRKTERDLACLLLADLSLSTDAYVSDHARVIDVIRDSLYLFAEGLSASQDSFAMYGFSSLKRQHIRFHAIKRFDETYHGEIRGRIQAIKPGYYTRMGAAIRQASQLLATQPRKQRVLLLLTDGKPNDLDQYEGRYGIEDTRHAILEARQLGLKPFCVTIDIEAHDYLAHIFGVNAYAVIHQAVDLPQQLVSLYAQITGQ